MFIVIAVRHKYAFRADADDAGFLIRSSCWAGSDSAAAKTVSGVPMAEKAAAPKAAESSVRR